MTANEPIIKEVKQHQALDGDSLIYRDQLETQLSEAITTGNIELLSQLLLLDWKQILYPQEMARIPENPLRFYKNAMLISNTYCHFYAKNGGLPLTYLHLLSEKYVRRIEESSSIDYLEQNVRKELLQEYCIAVRSFSTLSYSKKMKEIVAYIGVNLTNELSLGSIAEEFHMHPAHLARKFKKETNYTVIEYINLLRVELAKYYFQEGKAQLSDVAKLSGFNSHSYFTKVFKRITGTPPTTYIKKHEL